ncbi:MAG: hypothetical protein ACTHMX_01160 [Thermomicrobiales bacterium]
MPADPGSDHLAAVAYAEWRLTASSVLPAWSTLPSWQRIRWTWAAEGATPAETRERCCVGIYLAPWDELATFQRRRWERVFIAVQRARSVRPLAAA